MKAEKRIESAVALVSGGLDSATLLRYMKFRQGIDDIHAITFVYGQKHSKEIAMAAYQAESVGCSRHEVVDISRLGHLLFEGSALTDKQVEVPDLSEISEMDRRQPVTYVPNRNMVFISVAVGYAESRGIGDVFYGAQLNDEYGYWDCTPDFVDGMNSVLALNRRRPVKIYAPFSEIRKTRVVELASEMGVDLSMTWTCYRGGQEACGACPSCVERKNAFMKAGIKDPLAE